jgi:hypothetical protein
MRLINSKHTVPGDARYFSSARRMDISYPNHACFLDHIGGVALMRRCGFLLTIGLS